MALGRAVGAFRVVVDGEVVLKATCYVQDCEGADANDFGGHRSRDGQDHQLVRIGLVVSRAGEAT